MVFITQLNLNMLAEWGTRKILSFAQYRQFLFLHCLRCGFNSEFVHLMKGRRYCNIILSLLRYYFFLQMEESTLKCVYIIDFWYWIFVPSFHVRWACMRVMCEKVEILFPFSIWIILIFHWILFPPSIHCSKRPIPFHTFQPKPFFICILQWKIKVCFPILCIRSKSILKGRKIHVYIYNICKSLYIIQMHAYYYIQYNTYRISCRIEHARKKRRNLSLILNTWCELVYFFVRSSLCRPVGKWTIVDRIKATRSST